MGIDPRTKIRTFYIYDSGIRFCIHEKAKWKCILHDSQRDDITFYYVHIARFCQLLSDRGDSFFSYILFSSFFYCFILFLFLAAHHAVPFFTSFFITFSFFYFVFFGFVTFCSIVFLDFLKFQKSCV